MRKDRQLRGDTAHPGQREHVFSKSRWSIELSHTEEKRRDAEPPIIEKAFGAERPAGASSFRPLSVISTNEGVGCAVLNDECGARNEVIHYRPGWQNSD